MKVTGQGTSILVGVTAVVLDGKVEAKRDLVAREREKKVKNTSLNDSLLAALVWEDIFGKKLSVRKSAPTLEKMNEKDDKNKIDSNENKRLGK